MIGKTLGPYEILEQLGAGGMGQVYLGQDTRLGRRVAIKVLPAEFASDHERLARFEQEARAAAALNHPHIAVVHDVGSESGEDGVTTHFIVQEYLEGQSLRERLVVGALSVDKALSLAIEIGEALTAAHKAGIIHRDLKPDNVFVTAERHAKVLDFGLAKLTEAAPVSADLSMSPTMLGTVAGQVMGTAGYMAPEQAAGRTDIDHRADLFAFGCVFYEMLTGRQPFPGRSVAEILSRIQHEEPAPLADDKRSLPDSLQRVVDKCLAKDPDLRYQHADDMVVDLRRAKTVGIAGPPAADAGAGRGIPHGATGRRAVPVLVAVALAVVAALAGGWIARNMFRADAPDPVALTISLQDGLVIPTYRYNDALSRATIALSPDGELLAFVARRDGVGRLFLRDLRSYEIIEVPSSDRAMMPFFSPDGRQVGFMANGKLWRAAISGGVPVEIGNVTSAAVGASWGADGTIVYAPSYASRLWKIPAAGGVAEPLTTLRLEAGEASHRWPHVLPDGSGVLFSIKPSTAQTLNEGRIAIASLATGEYEVVLEGGTAARYIDGGYLAYAREGRLFAATFDLATRQVGSPVPVLENLVSHPTNGAAWFALASNGTIAWVPGKEVLARTELQWLTQDGTVIPFTLVDDVGGLAISPDGDRMLMQVPAANDKLWLLDLGEQPLMSRFSTGPGNDFGAAWSPDGQWVVFSSDRAGGDGVLYRLPASGGSTAEPLDAGDGFVVRVDVAGQARLLAFDRSGPDSASDIWVAAINPDGTLAAAPKAVTNTPFNEIAPALSTDGTLVAFASDESGESEIYVSRYPPMGSKRLVSVDGGLSPLWRPDTHTLLYWNDEGLHSVEIIATSEVRAGARDLLVGSGSYIDRAYAYMPDGSRLLLASTSDAAAWDKSTINVMLNWFPDLERRVASGR